MKPLLRVLPISVAALLLSPMLLTPGSASAQAQSKAHHAAHHASAAARAKAVAKAPACPGDPLPTMSATIPAASGCPAMLYSLRYIDTLAGTGEPAAPRKFLTVNYTGYLADGTVFDTSRGKRPITFPYGAHQVITGWDTGFEGMNVGGKRRLYIPYQLAYGDAGRAPVIPAKAALIFDVELLAVSDTPPAPEMGGPHPTTPQKPVAPAGSAPPTEKPDEPATPPTEPAKPAAVAPANGQNAATPPKR
jgi:peptidylprolyl isomerase